MACRPSRLPIQYNRSTRSRNILPNGFSGKICENLISSFFVSAASFLKASNTWSLSSYSPSASSSWANTKARKFYYIIQSRSGDLTGKQGEQQVVEMNAHNQYGIVTNTFTIYKDKLVNWARGAWWYLLVWFDLEGSSGDMIVASSLRQNRLVSLYPKIPRYQICVSSFPQV